MIGSSAFDNRDRFVQLIGSRSKARRDTFSYPPGDAVEIIILVLGVDVAVNNDLIGGLVVGSRHSGRLLGVT